MSRLNLPEQSKRGSAYMQSRIDERRFIAKAMQEYAKSLRADAASIAKNHGTHRWKMDMAREMDALADEIKPDVEAS